jgi:trehalose 6-phosphate synthase
MRPASRGFLLIVMVLLALAGFVAALVPLTNGIIEQWARRDVELRSQLVVNSIRDRVEREMTDRPEALGTFFERLTSDERILAVGLCEPDGRIRVATARMPSGVDCRLEGTNPAPRFVRTRFAGERVLVGVFPLAGSRPANLVVLHELAFVADRIGEARWYLALLGFGLLIAVGGAGTVLVLASQRRDMRAVLSGLHELRAARRERRPLVDPDVREESREIRGLLRDFRETMRREDGSPVEWSPSTLQDLLEKELPDAEVFVVSNREPYIHNRDGDRIVVQRPASGLVSALEPVMRACGGIWVAHGSGSADRDTVDADDHVAVPPGKPAYRLRRVWISDEEQEGYYYGLANEGLWPLCHLAYVRPIFREADWQHYVAVNQRFADAVVREATRPDPVIMVQDYHFALLPRMIREQLPKATILTFWHIPWPNAEAFGICPWKEELIAGLLGSTVLGFHTQAHCNNFFETVDRFMESRIDRDHRSVVFGGEETMVRPYPISIEWPPAALAQQQPVEVCRTAVRERYGLPPDMKIGVGIERFDYTKGILDRLQAIDELLIRQPEWRGRFTFLQIVAPTRSKLASYTALQAEAIRITEEVNARHGSEGYQPIHLVIRHHEPEEVYELFRAADVCVVSSLHDGMNLVAKEFVAARDDERGSLVLSRFAGASSELAEALIINPYDVQGMAEAIGRALVMREDEQRERMRLMRAHVRERNVYRWAGQILLDASRLRKRQRVQEFEATE